MTTAIITFGRKTIIRTFPGEMHAAQYVSFIAQIQSHAVHCEIKNNPKKDEK